MWLFKSEEQKEAEQEAKGLKQEKNTIFTKTLRVQLGTVMIKITLEDGRKIEVLVYGYVHQYVYLGRWDKYSKTYHQSSISGVQISDAEQSAKHFIRTLKELDTFTDDPKNPTHTWYGKAIEAKIVDSWDYEEDFTESFLVPKENI